MILRLRSRTPDGGGPFLPLAAVLALALSSLTTIVPASAGEPDRAVELRCKILPAPNDRGYKLWKVEIRKSSGEPVRQAVAASGDTVGFKSLEPGIYIFCLMGEKGRQRCQSIDLVPAPNQTSHRFVKKFEAPPLGVNQKDAHKVSARKLAVPDKARKEMIRAEEAQLKGDKGEALRHLERAIEICPAYADALNNLGTYYHRSGDYERSVQYFTNATRLDPEFFAAWVNLGGSLLALGKLQSALDANKRALELRPNDPLANSQVGINYFYLRNYAESKRFLEKVLSLDPYSANSPQLFLAHIAFAEKEQDSAQKYIRGYLELHPNSPQAPHLRRTLQNLVSGGSRTSQNTANPDQ